MRPRARPPSPELVRWAGRAVWLLPALVSACGGPSSASSTEPTGDPEALTTRAAEAWGALEPERAAELAADALAAGAGRDAVEIAARSHLAEGNQAAAIRVLQGASDPALLRLRARAQLAAGDLRGALDSLGAAHRRDPEEDPWGEAVSAALEATTANGAPYEIEGREASLPLVEAALPVVAVRVDAFETLAVIGTGAQLAVLDPSLRSRPGAIDELVLGDLRVRNVPHTVRSLEAVSAALDQEIGLVIGAKLLFRTHATLDGPSGRLVVRTERPPAGSGTRAPFRMLSGSFLALTATVGPEVGWVTVDSAGLFPIALTPGADEALGLDTTEWTSLEGDLSMTAVPSFRIGQLDVEGAPVVRGLLDESHARAVGAPVAGSVGWTLLSQLVTRFDGQGRALVFE